MTDTCEVVSGEWDEGGKGEERTNGKVVDVSTVDEHIPLVTKRRKQTGERHRRTDVAPGIARRVDVHAGVSDVGGVAEERQPHVLDVGVVEGLVDSAVELVACGVKLGQRTEKIRRRERDKPVV